MEPRPPGATTGQTPTAARRKQSARRRLKPPIQDHERSRLAREGAKDELGAADFAFRFIGFHQPPKIHHLLDSLLYAFQSTISLTDPGAADRLGSFFHASLRITGPVLLGLTRLPSGLGKAADATKMPMNGRRMPTQPGRRRRETACRWCAGHMETHFRPIPWTTMHRPIRHGSASVRDPTRGTGAMHDELRFQGTRRRPGPCQ